MGVEADHADIALACARRSAWRWRRSRTGEFWPMTIGIAPASSTWLTFSSTAAWAAQDVLDGGLLVGLRRDGGVAEVHDLQVLEDVEVEVLDVAGGVADRLLADPLRRRRAIRSCRRRRTRPSPPTYGAPMMTASAPSRSAGRGGERQAHEGRHVGLDHGEVAGSGEKRVSGPAPSRDSSRAISSTKPAALQRNQHLPAGQCPPLDRFSILSILFSDGASSSTSTAHLLRVAGSKNKARMAAEREERMDQSRAFGVRRG